MSATPPHIVPALQDISAAAKLEGGSTKGSESAKMQSKYAKEQNFEKTAQEIMTKMQNQPDQVTMEDATLLKSREARAIGRSQPPKDSVSSDAQRIASANERDTSVKPASAISPDDQSKLAKEQNFQAAASLIGAKIAHDPDHVTLDDANFMHSREQRARDHTEKGGIAAQAQQLASENANKTAPMADSDTGPSKPDKPEGGPNGGPIPPRPNHEQMDDSKESAFQHAVAEMQTKLANDPDHVTTKDANHLHSLEQKAHGHTEKGGVTSQAQRLAQVNEGKSGKVAAGEDKVDPISEIDTNVIQG